MRPATSLVSVCATRLISPGPRRYAKNLLLCHAKTVDLYRKKYQSSQGGEIGITLVSAHLHPDPHTLWTAVADRTPHQNCDWSEPLTDTPEARECADISLSTVMGVVSFDAAAQHDLKADISQVR